MFMTPPTLTEDFFEKKAAAGENFLGSLFKNFAVFGKKANNLTVFSGKNFPRTFSFSSEDPH